MDSYAVLGYPIQHSLSPVIYNAAFTALRIDARYYAIEVPPDSLKTTIEDLRRQRYCGWNVTIPHKERILHFLDEVDERAQQIGAVNAVVRIGEQLFGTNTDIDGITRSLAPYREKIFGADALILGAGGAARAAVASLISSYHCDQIFIYNRTPGRAKKLIDDLGPWARAQGTLLTNIDESRITQIMKRVTCVINASSAGMHPHINELPVKSLDLRSSRSSPQDSQVVLDLVYNPLQTRFLQEAEKVGAQTVRGMDVLIYQAMYSFLLWTGKPFPFDLAEEVALRELHNRSMV